MAGLQVCPNGAKVQLNMGITERRYRNWDAALGHYLRARELAGEGFCEPDYWIGVTRINQGDEVALGAEVRPRHVEEGLIEEGCEKMDPFRRALGK